MLVDGSGSINYQEPRNFDRVKMFMKRIARRFNVAKDGTHIGIVLYSSNVQVVSSFEKHMDISSLEAAIDRMIYPGMGTLTGKGLRTVKTNLFDASARPGVPNVLLVMTDGISQDDVLKPSSSLRNMGVTIFSIGIGKNFNPRELEDIATDPDIDHVFKADFNSLHLLVDKIKDGVCQGKTICDQCFYYYIFFLFYAAFLAVSFDCFDYYSDEVIAESATMCKYIFILITITW